MGVRNLYNLYNVYLTNEPLKYLICHASETAVISETSMHTVNTYMHVNRERISHN